MSPTPPPADATGERRLSTAGLVSGSAWAFGGRGLGTLLAIAINALLSRLLAPDELGTYFLAFSVVSLLVLVAQMGGKHTMVQLVAGGLARGERGKARAAARGVVGVGIVGSVLVGLAWWGFGGGLASRLFDSPGIAAVSGPIALWVVVVALAELHTEGHRALGDIRTAVLLGWVAQNVVLVLILGVALGAGVAFGFRAAVWTSVAGGAVILALSAGLFRDRIADLPDAPVDWRKVLSTSAPLLVTHLLLFVVGQSGLWILGALRPEEDVALYGAAFRLVTFVKMPLLIANAVVPPFISSYHARGRVSELQSVLRTTATAAAVPSIVLLLAFVVGGELVLDLIYGAGYGAAAPILVVLALGMAINVWAGSADLTLMLTGHQVAMLVVTAGSGVLGVLSAIWAGAHYGGLGVAWAATGTWFVQSFAMIVLAKRLVGVRPDASLSPASLRASWRFVRRGSVGP